MIDPGTAVFSSAILATLGWWSSQRAGRKDNRRKHTFEAIKETRDSDALKTAFAHVRSERIAGKLPAVSAQNESDYPFYTTILDHYEYTCSAVWTGDLDEKMLYQSECSRLIAISQRFKDYIDTKRQGTDTDGSQPTLYENITNLATRWSAEKSDRSALHLFVEWALMRPYTKGDLSKRLGQIKAAWNRGFGL